MEEKKERIVKANAAFCKASEESGLEICSWENMPGFDNFVNGDISESQLEELAKEEMTQVARTFSKFMVAGKDTSAEEMEAAKRKKAKDANKIYKKACTESGKSFCFFSNFTSWQDFVEGRIGDDELYHRAVEEVRKLADAPQQ